MGTSGKCVNCKRDMPREVAVSPDKRCKGRWCVPCQVEHGAFFLNWLYWEAKGAKRRTIYKPLHPDAYSADPYGFDEEGEHERSREGATETDSDGTPRRSV